MSPPISNDPIFDRLSIGNFQIKDRRVVVRADLDVCGVRDYRLGILFPTLKFLVDEGAEKVVIIGHRGRPKKKGEKWGLQFLVERFSDELRDKVEFIKWRGIGNIEEIRVQIYDSRSRVFLVENLRFWKEEYENNEGFSKALASLGDLYVNEAFASSHRRSSSIVGVPRFMKEKALGFRFKEEIENLEKMLVNPEKPVVVLIGGVKKDKLKYIEPFGKIADKVLVGGRLPEYIDKNENERFRMEEDGRVVVARLNPDKEDITINSIERFEEEVGRAGTVFVGGPLGKYEEDGHALGTKRVFKAIADSRAFKMAGGGDTTRIIEKLGLTDRFDWISVGGGASLEFLTSGGLPGLQALID